MINQLKKYIRHILQEEMIKFEEAHSKGLALEIDKVKDAVDFILVDTAKTINLIRVSLGKQEKTPLPPREIFLQALSESIISFARVQYQETCGAWEVIAIAAEPGHGPLMYELIMSYAKDSPSPWVMPDRRSVSSDAQRVWDKFYARTQAGGIIQAKEIASQDYHPSLVYAYCVNKAFDLKAPQNLKYSMSISHKYTQLYGMSKVFQADVVELLPTLEDRYRTLMVKAGEDWVTPRINT